MENDMAIYVLGLPNSGVKELTQWFSTMGFSQAPANDFFHQLAPNARNSKQVFKIETYLVNYWAAVARYQKCKFQMRKYPHALVIRNPFNLFADIYEQEDALLYRYAWIRYAQEALGLTRHLPVQRECVTIERWSKHQEYRERLVKKLGIENYENPPTPNWVHEDQWKNHIRKEKYRNFFTQEMLKFSEMLYGPCEALLQLKNH
jgi:hypothetical protein